MGLLISVMGTSSSAPHSSLPFNASVDSSWLSWGEWSHCSLSCGNGNRNRGRACTGLLQCGNISLRGKHQEYLIILACSTGVWRPALLREHKRDGALQHNPLSWWDATWNIIYGANNSAKVPTETSSSLSLWQSLPVSWSAWTRWSPCSRTCGTGQKVICFVSCLNHDVWCRCGSEFATHTLRTRFRLPCLNLSLLLLTFCLKVCRGKHRDVRACKEASCPDFWWK